MRVEIVIPTSCKSADSFVVRALLFNDSYEPVTVSRNAFVGPNLRAVGATGQPLPDSGTGTIGVVRSWLGANAGNQGNGHFVTAGAARFDAHERLHGASTPGFYNTNLDPLLTRVGDRSLPSEPNPA